ncbi:MULTISPECIES: abortive infection family protein [Pseudoclavibacter]|uniref:abortive infection family protein n=1 Tax=Pseudoclavibacter TaxID=255204 RepID=UPI000838C91E|nr:MULTISPECIES: abortive infection family protein [Pseudoclavibacter]
MASEPQRITGLTRRKLRGFLTGSNVHWAGPLDDIQFLSRIYDLDSLPSTDPRHTTATEDIGRHRIGNDDWEDDWVFWDERLGLKDGGDEVLLRFLAETMHPEVRDDEYELQKLLTSYNEMLGRDGYELYASSLMSGYPVYGWRLLGSFHGDVPELKLNDRPLTDPSVLQEHLDRVRRGLEDDPAAAISSSKELIESLFRIILERSDVAYGRKDDIPALYRKVADLLALKAQSVPESALGSRSSEQILRTLVTTVQSLTELRNELGLGHGRPTRSLALTRHARLALNATVTIAEFVLDTWEARIAAGKLELVN